VTGPTRPTGGKWLELWVKGDPDATDRCVDPLVDRLERIEASGVVDGVKLRNWGHQLDWSSPTGTHTNRATVRDRVGAAMRWAIHEGVEVPFKAPVPAGYGRMGPEYDELDLPDLALFEFRDGDLVRVTPNRDATESVAVADRLTTLEAVARERERTNGTGRHQSRTQGQARRRGAGRRGGRGHGRGSDRTDRSDERTRLRGRG
jgi:hypothetical protein